MERTYDAAVLGAGIAGSIMAMRMAASGWNTVLLDRGPFPRHKVCGEFLSPESQQLLAAMGQGGLLPSLQAEQIHFIRIALPSGMPLEIPLPNPAFGVSRYALDSALHQSAMQAGAELHLGMTVTAVRPIGAAADYEIEYRQDGEKGIVRARSAVAAWGRRPLAGLPGCEPSRSDGFVGVSSHYIGVRQEPSVEMYFFPGGYLGIVPIEGGRVNVAALFTAQAFKLAGKSAGAAIRSAMALHPGMKQRLEGGAPVQGTEMVVAPVITGRPLAPWETLPRIGDSALMIPPLCGDGMAMAIRSAERCAGCADSYLRGDITLTDWERIYTRSLRQEFAGPFWWGRLLQAVFSRPLLSQRVVQIGRKWPGAAQQLVRATRLRLE